MKVLYLLLISLIIPIESHTRHQTWINTKYELKVKFDFRSNKIRAKNLGKRGWTSFYRTRSGLYENRHGDRLILEGRDLIVYTRRFSRKNIVFRPVDVYLRNNKYRNNRFDQRRSYNNISGTWRVRDLSKDVEIVYRNNGIESRIKGLNRWVFYTQKDEDYFEDQNGNSYTIKPYGELIWLSDDGRTRYVLSR